MQPSAEDQLKFIQNIQKLLSEGTFTATYKYALLLALADLSIEKEANDDGSLELRITEIAEKFISYYWKQTSPYTPSNNQHPDILIQNSGRQGAILNKILNIQNDISGKLSIVRNDNSWKHLTNTVSKIVIDMPLWKLQTIADQEFCFLYDNGNHSDIYSITLYQGVAACFRQFHEMITNQIQSAWILRLHRIKQNQSLLGSSTDLKDFLFGSERSNLNAYRPILKELQGNHCFYCGKTIRGTGDVDHFIPWIKYPINLGHNFVLAHSSCNNAKSDHLADHHHLGNWMERNDINKRYLNDEFDLANIEHNLIASNHVTRWAYEQAEANELMVWSNSKIFTDLDPN